MRLCGNDKDRFIFLDKNEIEHKLTANEDLHETITSTAGQLLKCTVDERHIIHIEVCDDDTDKDE